MKVRDKLPKRRPLTTKTPNEGKWTEHKPDLREDFHSHCGYCGSYDGYRHTWYEVDHFIPKSLLGGKISDVEYSNLVYSCKFCNNKKLAKWPTEDISIPNANDKGFIDPCDKEYDSHLYRTSDGGIMWRTDLGKWMWETAFKFDERNYSALNLMAAKSILIDSFLLILAPIFIRLSFNFSVIFTYLYLDRICRKIIF